MGVDIVLQWIILMHISASNSLALKIVQIEEGSASTTWGLLGVTDRDQALLGIATVALFSCLGNIVASANGGASGLSAVARKNGCLEIIFCIGKPSKIVLFNL